jgi:phage baseplate assembly protein W
MPGKFLGIGCQFPVETDDNGQIALAQYEESISQAIWIVLGTAKGERLMRPDFGCGIQDLVFAVNDAGTYGLIASEVREALLYWEPRIDLLDVQVSTKPLEPSTLLIRIEYRVRKTNNVFNMVYPFYLDRSVT